MSLETEYEDHLAEDWGKEHHRYLKEAMPHVLKSLSESGDLDSYLHEVGNQAARMETHMMREHLLNPRVRDLPHLQKVRELQSRQAEVKELIRNDVIHQPTPD